jgi:hypothetical protein
MAKHAYVLGTEAYVDSYVRECPMFQKYWWWVNQMTLSDGKKHFGCTPHSNQEKHECATPDLNVMEWP